MKSAESPKNGVRCGNTSDELNNKLNKLRITFVVVLSLVSTTLMSNDADIESTHAALTGVYSFITILPNYYYQHD